MGIGVTTIFWDGLEFVFFINIEWMIIFGSVIEGTRSKVQQQGERAKTVTGFG